MESLIKNVPQTVGTRVAKLCENLDIVNALIISDMIETLYTKRLNNEKEFSHTLANYLVYGTPTQEEYLAFKETSVTRKKRETTVETKQKNASKQLKKIAEKYGLSIEELLNLKGE